MYTKIPDDIMSEDEFEEYAKRSFHSDSTWMLGNERGRMYFELLSSTGYDFSGKTVLDLGSGYGGVSLFFSSRVERIIVLDVNKDLLKIAYMRSKSLENKNFHAIVASGTNLPLRDTCINIVIAIGVLEWIPCSTPVINPELTQSIALKEIKRVSGCRGNLFLLAIENRYYLGYWMGRRDHHSGLRFVPILPRTLSDSLCRLIKGEHWFLERTYSYWEWMRKFPELKFKTWKVFTGFPSYTYPERIADLNNKDDLMSKVSITKPKGGIAWRIITFLGLMKFFCSNFLFICQ
jgi:ubiquinone/menaquinone biosynthesis C-methylase UbiE